MRRTLLVGCLLISAFGCAETSPLDDDESRVLAAEGPWIDEPLTPPPSTDDVASDGGEAEAPEDDGRGPWIDPQLPPRTGATPTRNVRHGFERDTEGWGHSGAPITRVARSTARRASGAASLAVDINGTGAALTSVPNPRLRAGSTVSFRIFIPAGARLRWVQPFVQQDASGNWTWTGNYQQIARLRTNAWNTLTVPVPANARSFFRLGVQFETEGSFRGTLHVDDVDY